MSGGRFERGRGVDRAPQAEDDLPDADVEILPRNVLADLSSLGGGLPEKVGRLLAAATLVLEDDPQAAFEFTRRARGMAPRSAVVREAMGVSAYRNGDYSTAKRELLAARRMSGSVEVLPLVADCERALGAPERAIGIGSLPDARKLRGNDAAELLIVIAGARCDLGQPKAAAAMLARPARSARPDQAWAARIRYAYAAALEADGDLAGAAEWFGKSAECDPDEQTDALVRQIQCAGSPEPE